MMRWLVLALCVLANWGNYAIRQVVSASHDGLRALGFGDGNLSLLWFAFMATHAIATPVFGALGDTRYRKVALATGVLLAGGASVLAHFTTTFTGVLVLRIVAGLGTGAVVPIGAAVIAQTFRGPQKASWLSLFSVGLFVGGVSGVVLGGELGYPAGLVVPGIATVVAALMFYVVPIATPAGISVGAWRSIRESLGRITGVVGLRWLGAGATCMAFAAGAFVVWLPDFLRYEKGIAKPERVLAIAFLFGLAGVLAGGKVADRWAARSHGGRMYAMTLAMASSVPLGAYCIIAPVTWLYIPMACGLMFFSSWYHAPMAASIDDMAPPADKSRAQAMVSFLMHVIGTATGPLVVAWWRPTLGFTGALLIPLVALVMAASCVWQAGRWRGRTQQPTA